MFLVEGLIIDERHKKVRLTDEQNKGVDFSNDKYLNYRYRFDNKVFNVISIFTTLGSKIL